MTKKTAKYVGRTTFVLDQQSPLEERRESSTRLDLVFSALSSPIRRGILDRLSRGESSVGELAEPFDVSLPAISKHLRILEEAHLITKVKEGRTYRCHLDLLALAKAAEWVNFYRGLWERQLDELSNYLNKTEKS